MYEANTPLLLLAMAALYLVWLSWPNPPWQIRLLMVLFWLLVGAANWLWTIRLPIDPNLGSAINIASALLLFIMSLITLIKGGRDKQKSPSG